MPIADGDVLRVTAKTEIGTDEQVSVYHLLCQVTTPPTDVAVAQACAAWLDGAYDEIDGVMSSGLNFTTVRVDNVTQDTVVGELAWTTLTTGGDASQTMPLQVAGVVRFLTNTLGSQGRKFIQGLTTTSNSSRGVVSAGTLAALALFASEVLAGINMASAADLVPGNYNQTLGRFVPWTAAVVNTLLGTQRRRAIGVGS